MHRQLEAISDSQRCHSQKKNLKMLEANFPVAWDRLKEQYDNKRKVVNRYLVKFFEIPTMSAQSAAKDLRSMIITTNDLFTTLPDYGIDTTSWDAFIVFSLTQKLDTTTLNRWHEELQGSKELPTFKQFDKFLETRSEIYESTGSKKKCAASTVQATSVTKPRLVRALASQDSPTT